MLLDNQYDELIEQFYGHPEFFSGIFQQLIAEKRYDGFNFQFVPEIWTEPKMHYEYCEPITKKNGSLTYTIKWWRV